MKNQKTRSGGLETLFKGHRLAGIPVTEGPTKEVGYFEDAKVGGVFMRLSDTVVVGIHRTALEMLKADDIVDLGDGTYRLDLNPTRAHIRMSAAEVNQLLSLRREQGATTDAPPFIGAAMPVGTSATTGTEAEQKPATGKQAAPKAGKSAKPAKAAATPKAGKPKADKAADATTTTAKVGKPASGKGTAGTVSLDERRKGKQAKAGKPTQAQTELPGLTGQEPVREAARSASNVQRLREPMPAEGGKTAGAKPGGRRKKATPATGKASARSTARGQAKPATGKATRGKAAAATGAASTATDTPATEAVTTAPTRGKGAAKSTGKAGTARTTKAKAGEAKAPTARGTAKSKGRNAATGRARGRVGTAQTAQVTGDPASVTDVKAAARKVIMAAGRPLPRRELLQMVQNDLGRPVPGKDPIENLATILYKDKDKGFQLVKSRGFWVTDSDVPNA